MNNALFAPLANSGQFQRIMDFIRGGQSPCSAFGVSGSYKHYLYSTIVQSVKNPILIITPNHII
ncbi:MAG: hypothetical protein KAQ68_10100, partial [Clostridiales bacterium]|nr:hypothetical protein [Clostridiales bacterium]